MARGLSTEVWPGAVFNPNVDVPVEEAQSRAGHYDDLWNKRDARIRISEHAEAYRLSRVLKMRIDALR